MYFIGVLNRDGGTFRTMNMDAFGSQLVEHFAESGHRLECRIVGGNDVQAALENAAADPQIDVLLTGGGDGTVSAAAQIAFQAGVVLAILPAGTMNLFARSLQLPTNIYEAAEALANGEIRSVDIATANGRPFVHHFGVGLHARLVRLREEMSYRSRWGKIWANLRAVGLAIQRPPRFEVEVLTARGVENHLASGITISNNPVDEGHLPYADRVDRGVLGVYIAGPMNSWQLLMLCLGIVIGRWRSSPDISEKEATHLTLRFRKRNRSGYAVIDGELVRLDPKVELDIHPGALKVLVPRRLRPAVVAAEVEASPEVPLLGPLAPG